MDYLLQLGRYTVTRTSLRAGHRTLRLAGVEQTRLRRPGVFPALGSIVVTSGFAKLFQPLLYPVETILILTIPWVLLVASWGVGVLTIEYRGMGGVGRIIGPVHRLTRVRNAIDDLLDEAEQQA